MNRFEQNLKYAYDYAHTVLQDNKTEKSRINSVGLVTPAQLEPKEKSITVYTKNRNLIKHGGKPPPIKQNNVNQANTSTVMPNSVNDIVQRQVNQSFVQDSSNQAMNPVNKLTTTDANFRQAQTIQQNNA